MIPKKPAWLTKKKKKLFFVMIFIAISTVSVTYVFRNYYFFRLYFHNNDECLIVGDKCQFILNENYRLLKFGIQVNGARVNGSLKKYCSDSSPPIKCSLPLFFNGTQNIDIYKGGIRIKTIRANYTKGSFECFFDTRWDRRLCYFANLSFADDKFFLFPPYDVVWDSPICMPHGRGFPVAPWRASVYMNNYNQSYYNNLTYRSGRYMYMDAGYLTHSLWHGFVEQILPLYQGWVNYLWKDKNVTLLSKSFQYDLLRLNDIEVFMPKKPEVFQEWATYEFVFMGATKVMEDGPHVPKERLSSPPKVGIEYFNFSNITNLEDMKNDFFKYLNLTEIPKEKPLCLFILRHGKRRIVNFFDALSRLQNEFPHINFTAFSPEKYSYQEQINHFRSADMVIAAHGAALSHVTWMNRGKAVIEIFPFKVECRDWYGELAKANGLHYSYFTPKENKFQNTTSVPLQKCFDIEPCAYDCLDKTLFTDAWVDIDELVMLAKDAIVNAKIGK